MTTQTARQRVEQAATKKEGMLRARVAELERVVQDYKSRYAALAELTATVERELASVTTTERMVRQWHADAARDCIALGQQLATVTAERDAAITKHRQLAEGYGLNHADPLAVISVKLERQLAALTLTWTTEKPTVAGRYLYRLNKSESWNVFLLKDGEHLGVIHGMEYAGPIPLPKEA